MILKSNQNLTLPALNIHKNLVQQRSEALVEIETKSQFQWNLDEPAGRDPIFDISIGIDPAVLAGNDGVDA